jgi:hypothetical protein
LCELVHTEATGIIASIKKIVASIQKNASAMFGLPQPPTASPPALPQSRDFG